MNNKHESYIGKHWHGEYGLGISFFVSCFLVPLISFIVLEALIDGVLRYTNYSGITMKDMISLLVVTYSIALITIIIVSSWAIVGTWRAATNRNNHTGKKFLVRLAKGFLAVQTVFVLFSAIIISNTLQMIAYNPWGNPLILGSDRRPEAYKLTIENEILHINGEIARGLNIDVYDMLEKHPEIKIVHLESKGGRRLVGYSLAGLFEERGISTFVEGTCASACTTAFLGGRKRLLHPSGHLMFHVARHIPGRNHKFSGAVKTRMNRTFMEEHGIPLWFINKALSTPPEDVWTPTHSELLEAGILTAISSTPSY